MKKDGAIKREEEEVVIKLHDLMSCEPAKYSMKNMMSHVFEVREMRHGRRTRERESERRSTPLWSGGFVPRKAAVAVATWTTLFAKETVELSP